MARILFAHGHLLSFDRKQHAIGKPYPPLATITAAAHLRALGHDVALYDPMLDEDTRGFARALSRARADVVVVYDDVFNWFTKMCLGRMRTAALAMIAAARAAGARIVVSGHDAADAPEVYLDAGADYVIVGEAEVTLAELVAQLDAASAARDAGDVGDIAGLVFRDRGLVRRTGPRALLKDLDALPIAAWDLVDVDRYRAFWRARHGYFALNVVTTRGCPYKCNWCAKPVYGNTYHTRSPGNVIAELRLLRDRYAPDRLWFCDDIFGLKARWLLPFAADVAAQGLALPFLCQTRADLMTAENVDALRRAGCAEAWLGVESGSQAVLDAMDKGLTVEHVRGAVARLRGAGIRIGVLPAVRLPGRGVAEIERPAAWCASSPRTTSASRSATRCLARVSTTPFGRASGTSVTGDESSDLDPLFPGLYPRDFYQRLSRTVHAEFRARNALRALRGLFAAPRAADGDAVRALGGWSSYPYGSQMVRACVVTPRKAGKKSTAERKKNRSSDRNANRRGASVLDRGQGLSYLT